MNSELLRALDPADRKDFVDGGLDRYTGPASESFVMGYVLLITAALKQVTKDALAAQHKKFAAEIRKLQLRCAELETRLAKSEARHGQNLEKTIGDLKLRF